MHRFDGMFLAAIALCVGSFFASYAHAQIPQPSDTTSVPIPGAGHEYLEGPVEKVNPANGSISIRIPVILPPSRGVTLPFSFMYDSSVYYLSGNRTENSQWARTSAQSASLGFASSEGWSSAQPIVSASIATWKETDPLSGTHVTCHYTYGYVFQDAIGTRHNLNLTNFYQDPNTDCAGDVDGTAPEGFNGQVVTEGSEGPIMGSIPAAWTNPNSTGAAQVTVTDGDGTVYSFSGTFLTCTPTCSIPFYPHLNSVTDRNGNIITITYLNNATSYKDTAARTVLNDSGFAISPENVTVSGLGAPYTVNWTTQPNPTFSSSIQIQALNGTTCAEPLGPPASTPSVSSLALPNGKSYTFAYDTTYGLVNKITYPTGGYARYVWSQNPLSHYAEFSPNNLPPICQMHYAVPAISDRFVSFDGSTEVLHQSFSYSTTWSSSDPSTWTSKTTTVTTTDLVRNTTFTTVYTYLPIPLPLVPGSPTNYQDPHAANPVEVAVVYNDTTGSLLKTVTKQWRNERLLLGQTNTYPTGPANETTWNYDANEMQIEKDDYDFGTTGVGALLRKSTTTYATSTAFTTNHILDKPAKIQVYDSTGTTLAAETDYAYDSPAATATSGIVQHSGGCKCGNLTSVSNWLNSAGALLTTTFTNDDTGQRLSATDPRGNVTSYSYTDSYSSGTPPGPTNAYVTTVTHPMTGSVNHVEKYAYAYASGDVTSLTDQNNLVTTYKYVDNLARLTETDFPDGGQSSIAYNDSKYNASTPSPSVTTTKKINGTTSVVTLSAMDGLGHVVRTELTSDPQGTVYTDTVYDGLGRVESVSNPYRSGDPTSSPGTTAFLYDALGRKLSATAPDNSVTTTAYCAGSTLVTDPTNRWRRSRTDGLGRLVEVDEPNAVGAIVASTGCPGTSDPVWVTSYNVDALGNLKQVVQNGTHQRTFTYDFLSRMTSAYNPETGTTTYVYDSDSNCTAPNSFSGLLVSKTDARNIRSCAHYDALNRQTSLSYSNGDPTVTTTYDQSGCLGLSSCVNIGHRTAMTDGAGTDSWAYQVDEANLRSIHKEKRTTNSSPNNITKTTTYYLDLAGNITQLIYPTGRTINYTYDAADRPSTAVGAGSGAVTYASDWQSPPVGCLASAVCYTPQGSIYAMSIGQTSSYTGFNLSETFNNRLQPNEIKAGTVLDIVYSFVDPTTLKNAGHVVSINSNLDSTRSQGFAYDQLNRITSAGTVVTTGSHCWGHDYTYDAWGNLLSEDGWTQYYSTCTETTMGPFNADGNNHLIGLGYDSSGDTQSDGLYSYTWDGARQMKTAAGVTYNYDGDGRRVAKVGSKLYWYGSGGEILAETDAAGNTLNEYVFFGGKRIAMVPASSGALYYAEDSLGTSRVIVQSNGTLCYDADFTPFGAERVITSTCAQNYKFEGKERDTETGNDDFGARYYSWRFGRWLSSDWSAVPVPVPYANLTNPQTLNLYAMVADDPETFADLDGHGVIALENDRADFNTSSDAVSCAGHAESCESAAESASTQSQVQAAEAKQHAQANAQTQNTGKPASLKVLSATVLPVADGCGRGIFGIQIDIKYQVMDGTDGKGNPVQDSTMIPFEEGKMPLKGPDGKDTYGPQPLSPKPTGADGTFHDSPVGMCSLAPFKDKVTTQKISMKMSDGTVIPVRSQAFTMSSRRSQSGTVTNGSDISVTQ